MMRLCALIVLLLVGVPSEALFDEVDHVDSYRGCILRIGRAGPSGIAPLQAVCHWDDVTVAQMKALLSRYTQYADFIGVMEKPGVIVTGVDGGRALVWQHDDLGFPLGSREAQTWNDITGFDRGFKLTWKLDPAQFAFRRDGSTRMIQNEGAWTVKESNLGGVEVIEDIIIEPGGFIPSALINWFQTCGLATQLKQVHALAVRERP